MALTSLCVFCASSEGARTEYLAAARELGAALAERHIGVVYGGATIGLMGAVAQSAAQHGGRVAGIIPRLLQEREVTNVHCTELHVVETMHIRKALMAEKSDAFLILPGGYGTFEEMFEVLTWQTLAIHAKPICLLNVAGFYDGLLAFLDHCVQEGVLKPGPRANLLVAATVPEALEVLARALPAS